MRSSDYWQERFTKIAEQNDSRAESAAASVTQAFEKAAAEIQAEIDAWYQRFADNNGISLADAKKLLTARERQELKWDVAEYIRRGEENALDQRWMKELENASARFHISRLEALQLRTRQAAEKAYGQERSTMEKLLRETYAEDYYRSAFEIQKGMGIGFRVDVIDDGRLQKLLKKPWTADGSTFSDRIWKSKAQLLSTVETELTRMCLTGDKPDRAIQAISKAMNVSKAQAGRLVMTESAYFATAAQHDCFKELDVEQYEICCALDEKTCEICGKMDLRHFPMNDFKPGLTAPPFHPNCRCAHAPFFDDEWDYEGTRAARGKDGKTYPVPAGMSYEEWKGKQDSRPGEGYIDRARKVAYNTSQDKEQYQRYRAVLGNGAPKSFREFQTLKYNSPEEWSKYKGLFARKNHLQQQLEYVWNGEKCIVPQDAKFDSVTTMAGAGSDKAIRDVGRLVSTYGGSAAEWKKQSGIVNSAKYTFDIHWYELEVVQYEPKLKHRKERKK